MPEPTPSTVRCASCGQPFDAIIRTVIDVASDPQGKPQLLGGRINAVQCPHCGAVGDIPTPILYHDSSKELLIAYIPMELNLSKDEQERRVGNLMNELATSIPKEEFKGYMFQPKRALTMQGMVDQILEADGVTPEMIEEQRQRFKLAQTFVDAPDEELEKFVEEHDDEIDVQFFQALNMIAQRMLAEGRQDVAQKIVQRQTQLAELSTFGKELMARQEAQEQILRETTAELESLGENAQRSDFLKLTLHYAGSDEHLQALVGLARPAFDYQFFQELSERIEQAPPDERDGLKVVRDRLVELTAAIDQQQQAILQQAAGLLKAMLDNFGQVDEIIQANLPLIDDAFMAVLVSNVQEAERRGEVDTAVRLKEIHEKVITFLQSQMQPELRFINDLFSVESEEEVQAMIAEHAPSFRESLMEVIDAVQRVLETQGNQEAQERLAFVREETIKVLS